MKFCIKDLVTFTKETRNGKPHFLCAVNVMPNDYYESCTIHNFWVISSDFFGAVNKLALFNNIVGFYDMSNYMRLQILKGVIH